MDPATRIPRWPLKKTPLAVAQPSAFAGGALPAHRLRGDALFLVPAQAGQSVALRLASQAVGRASGSAVPVRILSPSGRQPSGSVGFCRRPTPSSPPPETGVYRIDCQPGSHRCGSPQQSRGGADRVRVRPAPLAEHQRRVLFSRPGRAPARLPCGSGAWALERVSAAVFDPLRQQVWKQDDIPPRTSCTIQLKTRERKEIWRLKLSRPKVGVLEDHYVEMRGFPRFWDSVQMACWPVQ